MYAITVTDIYAGPEGTMRANLYLPGAPVPGTECGPECIMCGGLTDYAGSAHPRTGDLVPQDPSTGQHDGIVTFLYAPAQGAPIMESDHSHLRCVVESGLRLTVGPDEDAPVSLYKPRHAGNRPGALRLVPQERSATGQAVLVPA